MDEVHMKPTSASISFRQNGVLRTLDLLAEEGNGFFEIETIFEDSKCRVALTPKKPVEIAELRLVFPYKLDQEESIFMNGYQSWTVCKEYSIETTNIVAERLAKILDHKHTDRAGDREFTSYPKQNRWLHGVSYGYVRKASAFRFFGSLAEQKGFTFFDIDTEAQTLTVRRDLENRIFDEMFTAFDLLFAEGSENEVFDAYFEALGIPPVAEKPVIGYTTWYRHQQDISEKKLLSDIKDLTDVHAKYPCSVFFIDEGYENAIGDWLTPQKIPFPHGLEPVTKKILESSMRAGIWIAPFVCDKKSSIYKHHNDWLLRDPSGEPVLACQSWKDLYCIDFSNLSFRHHLKNVLLTMRDDWGISVFKFDFLYAVCSVPSPEKTRGEKMYEAIRFLKDCVGDSITIGMGVPLMSAAGIFDYCQVTCDYSPEWFPPLTHAGREQNSTYRALVDLIGHRHLSGRAFNIFNNVIPINNKTFLFAEDKRMLLAKAQGLSHGMVLTSDDLTHFSGDDIVLWNTILSHRDAKIDSVYTKDRKLVVEYTLFEQPHKLYISLLE